MKGFYKIISIVVLFVFLCNSSVCFALNGENATIKTLYSWKEKIEPKLFDEMENSEKKIPVWIWLKDIDHAEVEKQVYKKTGLCEKDLSVVNENFSDVLVDKLSLLADDSKMKSEVKSELQKYMQRTEQNRIIENQRTDCYLNELRLVQRDMYNTNNQRILNDLNISQNDIIHIGKNAPVYIVYLEKNDIERVAKNNEVTAIYYYDNDKTFDVESNGLSESVTASSVSRIKTDVGLDGNGVKIGIIDSCEVVSNSEISESRIHYTENSLGLRTNLHATYVASVAAGTNGVAPSTEIYSASTYGSPMEIATGIEDLANDGVQVANLSMGSHGRDPEEPYTVFEIYYDYLLRNYRVTLVNVTGNDNGVIGDPGLAYNPITVGGFFNQGTSDTTDDMMYEFSNYDNITGCRKPDFVSPQVDFGAETGNTGTSYAAPFVTGVVALLFQLRPSLKAQPEAVKAILTASCHRKVLPANNDPIETMSSGITNHQGAGAIDPYLAIAIAGSGNYGIRNLGDTETQNSINFYQPNYGSTGLNVSIAWSVENNENMTKGPDINLDLRVLRGGTQVAISEYENSSSEMVYVTPSSNETNYEIRVNRSSQTGNTIKYAYAFAVNKNRYQYTDINEGFYYLKNKASGKYLSLSSNGTVLLNNFDGQDNQKWLVYNGIIYSFVTSEKIAIGDTINGIYKSIALTTATGESLLCYDNITANESDGTVSISNTNKTMYLGVYRNSNISGVRGTWVTTSNPGDYQKWILESVVYQKGDVTKDGIINSSDALKVLNYATEQETPTDIEKFLADANGDGFINSSDSLKVLNISTGNID